MYEDQNAENCRVYIDGAERHIVTYYIEQDTFGYVTNDVLVDRELLEPGREYECFQLDSNQVIPCEIGFQGPFVG
jgi:hypothetical protein